MHLSLLVSFIFLLSVVPSSAAQLSPPAFLTELNVTQPVNLTHSVYLTDTYFVDCLKIRSPPLPALDPTVCTNSITLVCNKLTFPHATRDAWIWIVETGCALGYFLPTGAEVPSKVECEQDIFTAMVEDCGTRSQYNVGTINVEELPDLGGPGYPLTEGYPRYLLAPKRFGRASPGVAIE